MTVESLNDLPLYKRHMTDGAGKRSTTDDYEELQRQAMLAGIDPGQPLATLREQLAGSSQD